MTSVVSENGKKVLTMSEYIERDALRDAVESIDWYSVYKGKLTAGSPSSANALYKANSIYEVINNAPAADVAPVRHGRWIHTDLAAHWYGKDECSECTYHEHDRSDLSHFNYCPNCGAKMDGGDGNNAIT